jgi:hypothetical protein
MVTPLPKQNQFKEVIHVSPFMSSEPILAERVEFSTSHEYDSEDPLHLCEDESSSPLIEFEPLPIGPYHVVSNRGRESTLFIQHHL